MLTFFNTVLLQLVMPVRRDAVASQAAFDADQRTAVERNDRPTRARSLEQAGNIVAEAGNARHFWPRRCGSGRTATVGQSGRAGAAEAGIHPRQSLGWHEHDVAGG